MILDPVPGKRVSLKAFSRRIAMAYLVGMAISEIGPTFDITRERVYQILRKELRGRYKWTRDWMVESAS
jgi:DNA-directed RNA polymerase sigma subunit (sigma70/sigma32)